MVGPLGDRAPVSDGDAVSGAPRGPGRRRHRLVERHRRGHGTRLRRRRAPPSWSTRPARSSEGEAVAASLPDALYVQGDITEPEVARAPGGRRAGALGPPRHAREQCGDHRRDPAPRPRGGVRRRVAAHLRGQRVRDVGHDGGRPARAARGPRARWSTWPRWPACGRPARPSPTRPARRRSTT